MHVNEMVADAADRDDWRSPITKSQAFPLLGFNGG
jgi:hypothetical protein